MAGEGEVAEADGVGGSGGRTWRVSWMEGVRLPEEPPLCRSLRTVAGGGLEKDSEDSLR